MIMQNSIFKSNTKFLFFKRNWYMFKIQTKARLALRAKKYINQRDSSVIAREGLT